MTQMVTRCPKCATAFRITSTQLESAKGSVRCGSCLHIFKAQEHIVSAPASAQTAQKPAARPATATAVKAPATSEAKVAGTTKALAKPTTAAKPAAAATSKPVTKPVAAKPVVAPKPVIDKAKVLADEDDVLISDDMDKRTHKESTYEFDGFGDMDMHPKQTVSLFEREIRYDTDKDEVHEATDESWAEQLLDDDDEPYDRSKQNKSTYQSNSKPVAKESKPAEIPVTENKAGTETKSNTPLFSFVSEKNVDEESDFSEAFISATTPVDPDKPVAKPEEEAAFGAALFEEELLEDEEEQGSASGNKKPVKSSNKMRAFDTSRASLLMNIMPAPVEFTARRVRRWYQKKLWPTLALIAGVALFFQIAYFKFDYFSRVEPYRTAYVFSCPIFGCKVPSLVDTSKIVTTNLIVRNHPDSPNALMVDAILINNAPFEQPFPDLILAFSTLDDKPITSRRFTPKEYLGGELAGRDHIPKSQPVHITLELADPGPEAVNYHMSIP